MMTSLAKPEAFAEPHSGKTISRESTIECSLMQMVQGVKIALAHHLFEQMSLDDRAKILK